MNHVIVFDPDCCSACSACSVACMDQNDTDIPSGELPFRHAFEWEPDGNDSAACAYVSVSCMHCENAPCIVACPTGCIKRDIATGMTVYDNTACIGCHSCALACPFGALRFGIDGKMEKCDGCFLRLEHGLQPACVRACAFDALLCLTRAEYDKLLRKKSESSMVKVLGAIGHVT